MNTCKTCKHWNHPPAEQGQRAERQAHGECLMMRPVTLHDIPPEYDDAVFVYARYETGVQARMPRDAAGAFDEADRTAVITGPDFGCVQWAANDHK